MALSTALKQTGWLALLLLVTPGTRAGSGDVDGNGSVTRADAALALRAAGGLLNPSPGEYVAASVTSDTAVTIADALRIARLAAGSEPALPTGAMPTSFALTVSANTTRNVALPAGYNVLGRVTDDTGKAFEGWIVFRDTATGDVYGRFELGETGDYAAVLPAGTYQALVITLRRFSTGSGEEGQSDTALPVGNPVAVTANRSGLNFTRPDLPSTYNVTFSYTGTSQPFPNSSTVVLWDTGDTADTWGLNYLESQVLFTPAARPVPRGTYWVDVYTSWGLSSGLFQDYYMYFEDDLAVTRNTSRTLTFPRLYELDGDFTGTEAIYAIDVYAEQAPVSGRDMAGAYVGVQGRGYLLAMPPGALVLSVLVSTVSEETFAERLLTYTMPSARATKDVNLPALPAFRTISGAVYAPNGSPLANAAVEANSPYPASVPSSGVYIYHASTTTDANGRYTLHLPDGAYTVDVTP